MNAIIIDDDEMARIMIAQLCEVCSEINIKASFNEAITGIKYLNKHKIDLVFLDIHMPNFSGFDLLETLVNHPKVILVTADKNFATEAFEYECIVDYLVKPINEERFLKAIKKLKINTSNAIKETIETTEETILYSQELFVNIDRRLIKIDFNTINFIEAKGDYIIIKTDKENFKVHATLTKIEQKLPNSLFLRVHRSFIINLKKIIDIEDNSVLIAKNVIPISRSNRKQLMDLLNLL